MKNKKLKNVVDEFLLPEEAGQLVDFLRKEGGFSKDGEMYLASISISAKKSGKDIHEVINAFNGEWDSHWKRQESDIRGDLDIYDVKMTNLCAVVNICQNLKITNPVSLGRNIPINGMLVETRYSTYWVGPEENNGTRSINRASVALPFSQCKIPFFMKVFKDNSSRDITEPIFIKFDPVGSDYKESWITSKIQKVTII